MARDLRLFYLFRLLSTSYLFVPVRVAFATSRGLGIGEVMLLSSIFSLVVILCEVPTGALADRLGRRPAMMAGALAMIAACVTLSCADGFALFALGEALAALSMTLCSGADSAYLFDLLSDHGRQGEYAQREGTASAWHLGGNALAFAAGGLLGAVGLALPYLVNAGVAALAFCVALGMREDRPRAAPAPLSPREGLRHVRESFGIVARGGRLRWAIGYSALVFVLLTATVYIYQPYLDKAGFGIAQVGLIFAAAYLVAALVAHHADALRRRFAAPVLLWGLGALLVVTFLVLGEISGPWVLGVLVVQAAANGLYSPLVKPLLNHEIPDSTRRATVLSVESMVRRLAFGVFSPIVGAFMAARGPGAGLTLCGVVGLVGFGALALVSRRAAAPASAPLPAAIAAQEDPQNAA